MNASFGFLTPKVTTEHFDGWRHKFVTPLIFRGKNGKIYRMPVGSETDGGSSPQAIWNIVPPFGFRRGQSFIGWKSFAIHDGAYRRTLQVFLGGPEDYEKMSDDSMWQTVDLTEHEGNLLLAECMESEGCTQAEIKIVYDPLELVGWKAYREDRAALKT